MSRSGSTGSVMRSHTPKSGVARVEEAMRAESRLSQLEKPAPMEGESKGAYCWRIIRHCVRYAVDVVSKAELKDIVVWHGVHHRRRINHLNCLRQFLYNKNSKEYLATDGKEIQLFHADGRRKHTVPLVEEPIDRLIYAQHVNLYVGWIFNDDVLVLMTADFDVISISQAPGPILAATYNENIGEIVTVGAGHLSSWVFRYGSRHLLPRKTIQTAMDAHKKYSLLVLEETASRSQKAFAAYGTTVSVFNLYEGKLLEERHTLHVRTITAILFFNPLKYLITAAKDGSIKVWDEHWHLQVVFVGHSSAVSTLAVYPFGPVIMSASFDNTIRVWSLETCDEVDKVETDEPVLGLLTLVNQDNFASMSLSNADLWRVQNIHMLHASIGHKVEHLKSTDHPEHSMRILLLCRDASVRILSPATGAIITTLLGNPRIKLVDAAYAIADNIMFAVYSNGNIVKCDTSTNPCRVLAEWTFSDQKKWCNYLLVYEYVIGADFENDLWAGMKRAIATQHLGSDNSAAKGANRTLLLGGRKDGNICVFNWNTGNVEFEIEGHGNKGVLSMIANSKHDQLISAGLDNIIKIWRLYPYAQESLAPLMSFYCAHTPVYMTVSRSKLVVAFQEHTTATYSVVMYNLTRRMNVDSSVDRHDHGPEDDHHDSITGLTSSDKLRIVASSSKDGTIRIWNEVNNLVKVLKLNTVPHSLCFCTQRGDLLVGIGDHVHRIDHKDYLPKAYRTKMVSIHFDEPVKEKALEYDEKLLQDMQRDDIKRLKAAHSSFKFSHFMDILTKDETDEVMHEKREREAAYSALEQRENELKLIREGGLKATRRTKPTATTKRDAFEKYLDIFYKREKIELVDDDIYEKDVKVPQYGSKEYQPEPGPIGFFNAGLKEQKPDVPPPVRPDGFVPNSVLVHLLWPERKIQEQKLLDDESQRWVPPVLSREQLDELSLHKDDVPESKNKQTDGSSLYDFMMFSEYSDRSKITASSCDIGYKSKSASVITTSTLMLKATENMEKLYSSERDLLSTDEINLGTRSTLTGLKGRTQRKQLVKFVSYATPTLTVPDMTLSPPPKSPQVPSPSLSPSQGYQVSPTPSPSPTPQPQSTATDNPLPDFISIHIGKEWFDHFFNAEELKKADEPWTKARFAHILLPCLEKANVEHAVQIIKVLQMIHSDDCLSQAAEVHRELMKVLRRTAHQPRLTKEKQQDMKDLAVSSLMLSHRLQVWDIDFFTEIIVHFIEGDKEIREMCMEKLSACGVRDPHNLLGDALDGWDTWQLEETERPDMLRKIAMDWLEKWMLNFKNHVSDTVERLKTGKKTYSLLPPGGYRGRQGSVSIKSGSSNRSATSVKQKGTDRHPSSRPTSNNAFTILLEGDPGVSALNEPTYTDAINYFLEIQMETLLRHRQGSRRKGSVTWEEDEFLPPFQRNTVLVLPKLPSGKSCLVRLGETHTSKCQPKRETCYHVDLRLPPLVPRRALGRDEGLFSMPPAINLPLKTIYMNPFPSPIDAYDMPMEGELLLLTLKTAQKYFVPDRSVAPVQEQY